MDETASRSERKAYSSKTNPGGVLEKSQGRLGIIQKLRLEESPSISIGASNTRFSDINVDISLKCRPDVVADAVQLPFISAAVSEVVFTDVIEHLPRGTEQKALCEIHRILSKGGRLLISTPNKKNIFLLLDPSHWLTGHRHYSMRDVIVFLERASFRVDTVFTSGGVFAMLGVIWYSFVTWPSKRLFGDSLPYSPSFLRNRENAEYFLSAPKGGYTIFAIAVKP